MDCETSSFAARLTGVQLNLYAFIKVLMRGLPEAADVLQETNLVLLRNETAYDPSRPFLPWARGVARKCVLKFYSAQSHRKLVVFDEALVESLAQSVPCVPDDRPFDDIERLYKCMERLPPKQREIIEARYMRGEAVKAIAAREQRSSGSVAVLLHRVRQLLADCMERGQPPEGALG